MKLIVAIPNGDAREQCMCPQPGCNTLLQVTIPASVGNEALCPKCGSRLLLMGVNPPVLHLLGTKDSLY